MNAAAEFITTAVSKEQGLSFKSNKLFARRTIPGSAGMQTKELSWGIKDYDGSHLSSHSDASQAQRLVARGKAVRDLQALLTSSVVAGAQAVEILRAFNLVYWLVPTVERLPSDSAKHLGMMLEVGQMICHKNGGHPLEGFSGCSVNDVWAGLPHALHQAVACWLKGHYHHVRSGRSNEYQLAATDAEDPAFKQQQMAAFPCLPQLQVFITLHMKLSNSPTDVHLKLCEQFIMDPEVRQYQLPARGCTGLHVLRCHLHGPGIQSELVEQGFLKIQEQLDMTQHQLFKNADDVSSTMWLEGHACLDSLLLDLTLVRTSFPTMGELLIAAKALWMAMQRALQYFPDAVGVTILLNDRVAMIKEYDFGSAKLQCIPQSIVPVVTYATASGETIVVDGENLPSGTTFSAKLPGKFSSYPLRVESWPSAQKVMLKFPEWLRSVTAAEIQVEACQGHYKSVQTRLSRESAASSSQPRDSYAMQPQSHSVAGDNQQLDKAVLRQPMGIGQSVGSPAVLPALIQAESQAGHTQGNEQGATQPDAVFCASCQQQVLQDRATHRLPALGQYGWFCQRCQGQATLRGAILQILGRKGHKGATFADLKKDLERYRRSIARKSISGEYGLLGDAIPEKSQLAWMVDGQDGRSIGLPALVKKLPHRNRLCILYTLAVQEDGTQVPMQSPSGGTSDQSMGEEMAAEASSQDGAAELSGQSSSGRLRRSQSVDGDAAGAAGQSQRAHSDLLQEEEHWQAKLDRLQCSTCKKTEGHTDFLLCDSCAQGHHARCLGQQVPSTRFWWCPDCLRRGLTIKGLILQVVEESGDKGLTAAEITEQVLSRRPNAYPHSVRGERSRLVHGFCGKMVNGRPVLECIGGGVQSGARYRLAPDPDFTDPVASSSRVTVATGYTGYKPCVVLAPPGSATLTAANALATEARSAACLASESNKCAATTTTAQPKRVTAQNATAAGSATVSVSPPRTASVVTARLTPTKHLQHTAVAQTDVAVAAEAAVAEARRKEWTSSASPVGHRRADASRRYISVPVPGAGTVQQATQSSVPRTAASGDTQPRSATEPHQSASLITVAHSLSGPKQLVKVFDPARELLERTTVSPADLARSGSQHDTPSLADLIPEQVRAHQGAADQAGLIAGARPPSYKKTATQLGNRGAHAASSAAKRRRSRYCLDSDSDEELADQKKLSPEHATGEVVVPFSLRSSHQGPGGQKQVVTIWDIGQVYQGASLQHFGKLVDGTYHYQYPVGYKAVMQVHNKSTRSLDWTLEVQVVDDAPRFQVANEKGYEYAAPPEATEDNRIMGLQGANDFGFRDEIVIQAIEQMYTAQLQRAGPEQGLVEAAAAHTAPTVKPSASVGHHTSPTNHLMPGTMSRGHDADLEQQTGDLQHDAKQVDHGPNEGDEATVSDADMEADHEAEPKQSACEPASAQKATHSPVHDTVTVADSLPNEDTSVLPPKNPDQDRLAPHGVPSLLQRLHVMDATSAPLDEIEEGITQLLSCFPETEEHEGYFSGWMMNMSMSDDNDRQLRIRGIFADIQFLASHTPDAQVLAGTFQMLLQALLKGLQR